MVPEKLYHASSGHIQLRKVEADPLQQTDTTVLPAASTGLPLQRNSLISIDLFLCNTNMISVYYINYITIIYLFNTHYTYILLPPFPSNTIMWSILINFSAFCSAGERRVSFEATKIQAGRRCQDVGETFHQNPLVVKCIFGLRWKTTPVMWLIVINQC